MPPTSAMEKLDLSAQLATITKSRDLLLRAQFGDNDQIYIKLSEASGGT